MFKKLVVGGKETDFKCSAATSILYKRLFGKSLTTEMTDLAQLSSAAFELKRKWDLISESDAEDKNEKIAELLSSDSSLGDMAEMTERITPQMAYIMWLEANKPQREVFAGLTEEAYILWLSSWDVDDLSNLSGDILDLWNRTNKTNSNLKNV